jgi:hypothetical protein
MQKKRGQKRKGRRFEKPQGAIGSDACGGKEVSEDLHYFHISAIIET